MSLNDTVPGYCLLPLPTEDNMHEFELYDADNKLISDGYFSSIEVANEKAREWLGADTSFTVKDADNEQHIKRAIRIRNEIKRLKRSFSKSKILIDMSTYKRIQGDEIVYFRHDNAFYVYRSWYSGDSWVEKMEG